MFSEDALGAAEADNPVVVLDLPGSAKVREVATCQSLAAAPSANSQLFDNFY